MAPPPHLLGKSMASRDRTSVPEYFLGAGGGSHGGGRRGRCGEDLDDLGDAVGLGRADDLVERGENGVGVPERLAEAGDQAVDGGDLRRLLGGREGRQDL